MVRESSYLALFLSEQRGACIAHSGEPEEGQTLHFLYLEGQFSLAGQNPGQKSFPDLAECRRQLHEMEESIPKKSD